MQTHQVAGGSIIVFGCRLPIHSMWVLDGWLDDHVIPPFFFSVSEVLFFFGYLACSGPAMSVSKDPARSMYWDATSILTPG